MATRRGRPKKAHQFPAKSDNLRARTAADKKLAETLTDFTPDELRQIPVVPAGIPLKEGAVYIDLQNRTFGPFVANGGATAKEHHRYVPKAEVPYDYWNRLVGKRSRDQVREEEKAPSEEEAMSESMIDKTLADSFPTSDPPSWTTGREKH